MPSLRRSSEPTVLTASARIHYLIEWLRSGQPLTTTLAAEALGVSRRTIVRDLAHLRDSLCLSINYDPAQGSYTLDDRHNGLPFIPHPDLLPAIVNARLRTDLTGHEAERLAQIRFSRRSVAAYEHASGLNLSAATAPDGSLDVFVELRDELVRWILSSGAEAEVLAPPELRDRVVMEIQRMRAVYLEDDDASA